MLNTVFYHSIITISFCIVIAFSVLCSLYHITLANKKPLVLQLKQYYICLISQVAIYIFLFIIPLQFLSEEFKNNIDILSVGNSLILLSILYAFIEYMVKKMLIKDIYLRNKNGLELNINLIEKDLDFINDALLIKFKSKVHIRDMIDKYITLLEQYEKTNNDFKNIKTEMVFIKENINTLKSKDKNQVNDFENKIQNTFIKCKSLYEKYEHEKSLTNYYKNFM